MFGCYRRSDAADPDTYCAAVTMVLSRYSAAVVEAVTDPFNGLPSRKKESGYSGMPDVADVKEACEDEATRQVRMAEFAKLPRTNSKNYQRLPAPKETRQGAWANVLIHTGHPKYEALKARTELEGQDPRDWKIDEHGLHVSLAWLEQPGPKRPVFQQFSEADLRRMYPAREADGDEKQIQEHS